MLTGSCGLIYAKTPRPLEENEILFVLEGKLSCKNFEIKKGSGIARIGGTEIFLSPALPDGARCLSLRFDSAEIKTAALSVGIRDGKIFDFTPSEEFENAASCFFSSQKEYDNAMLEHGIAYTFLSFVKKSLQTDDYIAKTEQYIEENLCLPIRIDDIAAALSISRGYLRNVFYREKGISPQEYLMQRRIERAKLLLSEGSLPVASVAAAVGYSDALGFSRIFKKHTGVSPSQFREKSEKKSDIAKSKNDISIEKVQKSIGKSDISIEKPKNPISPAYQNTEPTPGPSEPTTADAITAALALQIEKAAAQARAELERKEEEKKSPPPFWLL